MASNSLDLWSPELYHRGLRLWSFTLPRELALSAARDFLVLLSEATMGNAWSAGFANDIVVVRQPDGTLRCSPVNVLFQLQDDVANRDKKNISVSINGRFLNQKFSLNELNPGKKSEDGGFRFTSSCLERMRLRQEPNDITFTIKLRGQDFQVKARIFLWRSDSRIVITDVDGTITKSDKRGMVFRFFGKDWTQDGVCRLFSAVESNGYEVIYLSGRPRYEAEATRNFVDRVRQDGEVLPKAPVIVSPDGWIAAIKREVLNTQDVDFKIPMLKQILELFPEGAVPFHAGFGNRPSDESAYLESRIPYNKIFHLNRCKGAIEVKHKNTVVAFFPNNYNSLFRFVDDFFPQVQDCGHFQSFAGKVKSYIKSLFRGTKIFSRERFPNCRYPTVLAPFRTLSLKPSKLIIIRSIELTDGMEKWIDDDLDLHSGLVRTGGKIDILMSNSAEDGWLQYQCT